MSWLNDLYQTYENHLKSSQKDDVENALLPIAHSTQNAQITIVVDGNGGFVNAYKVDKERAVTIIPATEDSASRSAGDFPHPLADKLEYVAGDYEEYVGKDNTSKHTKYLAYLKKWSESDFTCFQIQTIYGYVSKGTMIGDLVKCGVLEMEDEKLSTVKIENIEQKDCFVRFSVDSYKLDGDEEMEVYLNKKVFDSFTQFYLSTQTEIDLCYATGKYIPCSTKHPSKIRNSGDKSKLISANDTSGFTFRGRFSESSQVASVGYETSQKAHNALRWLIKRGNSFRIDNLAIVAWEIGGKRIVSPLEDTYDNFSLQETEEITTNRAFVERLRKAANGYQSDLKVQDEVVIMALEAATTGRLSIRMYEKISGSQFVENILYWHSTCIWRHRYKKDVIFAGAPSPREIAVVVYGNNNDKTVKSTVERLIPCIVRKKPIPKDIVRAAVARAGNPNCFENDWEFRRAVSVTCALIRKERYDRSQNSDKKEEWEMALDRNEKDRSYVFGRLLGAAQRLESYALYKKDVKRSTAAERYMQQFAKKPVRTMVLIENAIAPYKLMLKAENSYIFEKELQEIYDLLDADAFKKEEPLSELYLLGYNCQLNSYRTSEKIDTVESNDEKENN